EIGYLQIHRIPLNRTAVVEVLNAESPSCIWVRLTNHITDRLILTEPCDLVPRIKHRGIGGSEFLRKFEYCLAPIRERTYARCRILEVRCFLFPLLKNTNTFFYKCLARLPMDFAYHPWQAIMISLAGMGHRPLRPRNQDTPPWTPEQCARFRQVLESFELLKTRTVKSSVVYNDYSKPIMVELFGIPKGYTDTSPDGGISIAALSAAECCGRVQSRRVADASKSSSFSNTAERKLPSLEEIPRFRRTFPSDWRSGPSKNDRLSFENAKLWEDWSPLKARVPPIEVKWLDDHGYYTSENGYLVNIEGSQTQSPYEFYARPIKRERITTIQSDLELRDDIQLQSECDAMLSANEELRKYSVILDSFYSLAVNRSPIEKNQCHCTHPAMCMQLCMYGVKPSTVSGGLEWEEGAKVVWRELLREDLPVVIWIPKRLNSADDSRVLPADEPAWRRPGVIFIQSMKVCGEDTSILEKFSDAALCPNNGLLCDDVPRVWD
ncbi:hypothetical protein Angca_001628, partial [Angiostrongylus cantonensis]